MKKLVLFTSLLMMSACATRTVKILDAQWVSMKNSQPADPQKLTRVNSVDERYCSENWSGSYGLMDEVVKQAEAAGRLDYIKNASFSQEVGRRCVTLVGEGYRL